VSASFQALSQTHSGTCGAWWSLPWATTSSPGPSPAPLAPPAPNPAQPGDQQAHREYAPGLARLADLRSLYLDNNLLSGIFPDLPITTLSAEDYSIDNNYFYG